MKNMSKLPIILTLLLIAAWGYTSWYWYVCNIKWLCDSNIERQSADTASDNLIRYDDVFEENVEDLTTQGNTGSLLTEASTGSSAPKLSSEDVLSENKRSLQTPEKEEVEKAADDESQEATASGTVTEEAPTDTQELPEEKSDWSVTICEKPLVWPIGLGAQNNVDEVERLEAFLVARWENITLDGVYGQEEFEAIKKFQLEYRADILDPWEITEPTGYVFRTTIKKINEIACK